MGSCAVQLCAPREVVLQQMWREEEDGTFIVLLHSTKHRKASLPPASWSWWQPIRAEVRLPYGLMQSVTSQGFERQFGHTVLAFELS